MAAAFRPDAGADHDDLGGVHPGDAAHQDAAAARGLHQGGRAHLGREPAGHLGHRGQQGQRAVGRLHGLVGDAGYLAGQQFLGEPLVGGQVQVSEQDLAGAHPMVLLGNGLLDLQDQVAGAPYVVRGGEDPRAGRLVLGVGDRRAGAGLGLDEDVVPVKHEFVDPGGGDGHPVLVVLDLSWDADLHGSSKSRQPRVCLHDSVTVRDNRTIFGLNRETGDIISPCLG